MLGRIVNSLLHTFRSIFNSLCVINRPITTKVFTVNCEFQHCGVKMFNVPKHLLKVVMESGHQVTSIIEILIEIFSRIFTWDRDISRQKISPAAISYSLSIEMNGEVWAVNLFRGNPENFWCVKSEFANGIDELCSVGILKGRVFLEGKLFCRYLNRSLLLFLH
jgi:hypothetical protein